MTDYSLSNCPALINPSLIKTIPIDAKKQYTLPENYEEMDFYDIEYGFKKFISSRKIHFQDYIGRLYLTGNQLLYYPRLAKKLRDLKLNDYPSLERKYAVDTS